MTIKSLVFALYIGCWFNIFLFFVLYGALGLLLWLESKKKGERKSLNTDGSSVSKVDDLRFGTCRAPAVMVRVRSQHEAKLMACSLYCMGTVFLK